MTTYLIEYAKSARSTCKGCKLKIEKSELRCGNSVDTGDHPMCSWFHLECYKVPNKLEDASQLEGLSDLKKEDQKKTVEYIEDHENKTGSAKWKKGKVVKGKVDDNVKKVMQVLNVHNVAMLKKFLSLNNQKISGSKTELSERVADGMVNGTLPRCPKCSGAILRLENGTYKCPGYFDDVHFKRCSYKWTPGSSEIPEEGIAQRGEWKQHGTEKDDALKEAINVVLEDKIVAKKNIKEDDDESDEKPKKRKAKTDAKKKTKKVKKDASDDDDDEDYE
jgi:hypothetical protein